jgi:hypothetical protein
MCQSSEAMISLSEMLRYVIWNMSIAIIILTVTQKRPAVKFSDTGMLKLHILVGILLVERVAVH